jgi:hypothetical protein
MRRLLRENGLSIVLVSAFLIFWGGFFYVFLTAFLYQKGSAESRKLEGENPVDRDPRAQRLRRDTPWPVKRGGLVLKLYEHSLSIAFFLLLLCAITLHAVASAREYSQERVEHGEAPVSVLKYVGTFRFWFESFQNWQS